MKKIIILTAVLLVTKFSFSQVADSTKKLSAPVIITGSVDAYYRYDFHNPKTFPYNSFTSFTRSSNSFELGMASIRADHSFGKVSATVDLGYGKRVEEYAYNDVNTRAAIKQLYITYAPSNKIKFTFGTWGTHIGYEVLDPYLNRNYSISYMFTYGPFSHTGLKADISLGSKSVLMVGISNPTDFRSAPGAPKSLIAQFSTASKNDKLKAYFNFVGGKQSDLKKVIQGDVVGTYSLSTKFSLGINGTFQTVNARIDTGATFHKSTWYGAALYINYDPVSWFGVTLRNEYIGDKDNYLGLKHVFAPTISGNFKVDNLIIIPEFRVDNAGNNVFYKNQSENTNSTANFVLAVVYHF